MARSTPYPYLIAGTAIAAFAAAAIATGDKRQAARRKKSSSVPLLPQQISPPSPRKGLIKGPLDRRTFIRLPWLGLDKSTGQLSQRRDKQGRPLTRIQVVETPSELEAQAENLLGRSTTGSAYALATMIASEHGSASPYIKGAIANTAWNQARTLGKHIEELLAPDGTFGGQQGRYASTKNPPTEEDLLIAEAVLDGRLPDVTGGALHFDSPSAQRALAARHEPGYEGRTPEAVAASRARTGLVAVYLPGIDPNEVRFWRRSG